MTDRESTSVTIRWFKPMYNGGSSISGYQIIAGSRNFLVTNTSTTYYTVTGLSPNTKYEVKICSQNIVGCSNMSSVVFTSRGKRMAFLMD